MFTDDVKNKSLNTLTGLKGKYASSNKLAEHCDVFASALNSDDIPEKIKENICNFIDSCLKQDFQSLDSRIKYSNDISLMLSNNYKLSELKYNKAASHYDMTQETIFILGSVVVTLLALASGSGILIAGAAIGLGLAVTDMFYRLPHDIHSELKNDSEYKNLSLTKKLSYIAKKTVEDKLKLSCASINLAGAVFLFTVLFSPALIMSAPISVPAVIGVIGIVGLFSIGKKYYEWKSELNTIEKETKNIHNYSNSISDSLSSFKDVLDKAKEEKIKIEESTHVENDDTFKQDFKPEEKIKTKTNPEQLGNWAKSLKSSSKQNGLYTKIKEEEEGEGEGEPFTPKPK